MMMNDLYEEVYPEAPVCHFTPMEYMEGELMHEPFGYPDWWECDHCGHTKDMQ